MIKKIHVISGLPRSGSTLLSALLRQNPSLSSGITSPVIGLVGAINQKMAGDSEFVGLFDDAKRREMLRGVFNAYYAHLSPGQIVFDTNRNWTGKVALLGDLYPDCRIICCVREIGWIIDSVERMLNKNPLRLSRIFRFQPGTSTYARADMLMNTEAGLIGRPWSTLREAWFGEQAKRLILIPYDRLTRDPRETMIKLYAELGEPPFEHDFNNITYDTPDYDEALGLPGLHKVKPSVVHESRAPSIPPDLFAKYADANFWQRPELNLRAVRIL